LTPGGTMWQIMSASQSRVVTSAPTPGQPPAIQQMPAIRVCEAAPIGVSEMPKTIEKPPVHPVGYSIRDWCEGVPTNETLVWKLIREKKIKSVFMGRQRLIVTSPREYVESLLPTD
jgi:hypothetical protein